MSRPDYADIPIFINSCNRYECLLHQVTWLLRAGYENLTILDNASTFDPLLEYLDKLTGKVNVVRLQRNYGKFALWDSGAVEVPEPPFVYTDPDVIPDAHCPDDVISIFIQALERNRNKLKCGFGLRIDDIPDHYALKAKVVAWESQFWTKPARNDGLPCEVFDALIDTTFAVYSQKQFGMKAIRTGPPYVAKHATWYLNSSEPTLEQLRYEATSKVSGTWWLKRSRSGAVNAYTEARGIK